MVKEPASLHNKRGKNKRNKDDDNEQQSDSDYEADDCPLHVPTPPRSRRWYHRARTTQNLARAL